jgi:hypothetical protein
MGITEEQLKALCKATDGEVYDVDYKDGEWMYRAVETHETLDMFLNSSKAWAEKSKPESGIIAGLPYVCWEVMQAIKGQPRDSLSVIDFGDFRVAVACNITNYL